MTLATNPRPALEVADVIRAHGDAFRTRYDPVLSSAQRRALRDLAVCRTAALGGHLDGAKKAVCIVSGGNIDPVVLSRILIGEQP